MANCRSSLRLLSGLLFTGFALLFAQTASAADGYAIVRKIQGSATFTSAIESGPLAEGKQLVAGYTVTTDANSYVDLDLGDNGDALRVEADSTVKLTELTFRRFRNSRPTVRTGMEVTRGHVVANVVRKLSRSSRYRIKTPTGVAGIRGTCVRAGVSTVVAVIGTIQFTPLAGGGVAMTIRGGSAFMNNQVIRVTATQTQGIAMQATQATANTANAQTASMVQQTLQQFTQALATQAASSAQTPQQATQIATQTATAVMNQLQQAVQQAAATAPASIRNQVQQAVQAVQTVAPATTVQAAANAAASAATVVARAQGASQTQASQAGRAAGQQAAQQAGNQMNQQAQQSGNAQQIQQTQQQVQQTQAAVRRTVNRTVQITQNVLNTGGTVNDVTQTTTESTPPPPPAQRVTGPGGGGGARPVVVNTQNQTIVDTTQNPTVTGILGVSGGNTGGNAGNAGGTN